MGKVSNAKRKQFFEELKRRDEQKTYQVKVEKSPCCLYKYQNKLPDSFKKCFNCPDD